MKFGVIKRLCANLITTTRSEAGFSILPATIALGASIIAATYITDMQVQESKIDKLVHGHMLASKQADKILLAAGNHNFCSIFDIPESVALNEVLQNTEITIRVFDPSDMGAAEPSVLFEQGQRTAANYITTRSEITLEPPTVVQNNTPFMVGGHEVIYDTMENAFVIDGTIIDQGEDTLPMAVGSAFVKVYQTGIYYTYPEDPNLVDLTRPYILTEAALASQFVTSATYRLELRSDQRTIFRTTELKLNARVQGNDVQLLGCTNAELSVYDKICLSRGGHPGRDPSNLNRPTCDRSETVEELAKDSCLAIGGAYLEDPNTNQPRCFRQHWTAGTHHQTASGNGGGGTETGGSNLGASNPVESGGAIEVGQ